MANIIVIRFAFNSKPDNSDYYEVRVYNEIDVPTNFQVGAKVTLHTRTDGLTHQEIIGKDGGAVFWEIKSPTNFVFQVDIGNTAQPFVIGGSDIIKSLPGLMKVDLSTIPEEKRQLIKLHPETIKNVDKKSREYLKDVDERGDIGLQKTNAPWGVPHSKIIINRLGYVLGYDIERKLLNWVAYSIFPSNYEVQRSDRFVPDPSIPINAQAKNKDYRGSGYDRGHMISPADLRFKGPVILEESFYLSTIAPQTSSLNRDLWRRLESHVREVVEVEQQPVFVMAGPLFIAPNNDPLYRFKTIGESKIPVPTHFFRIMAKQLNDELDVFALIAPNVEERGRALEEYLVSIAEIEQKSGFNFFPLMNPETANEIKYKVRAIW